MIADLKHEHKNEMTFIGFHADIRPDEGCVKCPEFRDKEYNEIRPSLADNEAGNGRKQAILDNGIVMFAICLDGDNGFTYWIAGIYRGGEVPEGLSLCAFPESDRALFSAKGPLPGSLQSLNDRVVTDWLSTEGKARGANAKAMIEVCSAGNMQSPDYERGIWIPVTDANKSLSL